MWVEAKRVWIGSESDHGREYAVEHARSYRDRLVLKLAGIDDAGAAAELAGRRVRAAREEATELPEGSWWRADLVGLAVVDESGARLGTVDDVVPTGGKDLLCVERPGRGELLVPLVDEYVLSVEPASRTIRVRVPPELDRLNET